MLRNIFTFLFVFVVIFGLSFDISGTLKGAELSRREARKLKIWNPVRSVRAEVKKEEKGRRKKTYKISESGINLHKKAVKEFYAGNYAESEASFSLAYLKRPDSSMLLLDYALCSILFPKDIRSSHRALTLIEAEKKDKAERTQKSLIIEGLVLASLDKKEAAEKIFRKAGKHGDRLIPHYLIIRMELGKPLTLDPDLLKNLMPEPAPTGRAKREKRAN